MGAGFGDAVAAQAPRLRKFALTLSMYDANDVDDLVQDCIVRALSREHQFQPGTNLRSWLMTILYREFINERRAQKRRGEHCELTEQLGLVAAARSDIAVIVAELARAAEKLPADWRAALLLVSAGHTYEESAAAHNVPVETIRSRTYRARQELRAALDR